MFVSSRDRKNNLEARDVPPEEPAFKPVRKSNLTPPRHRRDFFDTVEHQNIGIRIMFWTETCFERYAPRQEAKAVTPVNVPPTGVISDLVMSATPPHMPMDAILPRST